MEWLREKRRSSKVRQRRSTSFKSSPPSSVVSFPDGIKVLHDCPNAALDICFVHGLTGDRDSTWTASGQTTPWPKTLLPPRLERARILTYGYDAYVVRKGAAASTRLTDHAQNFLHDLTTDRASAPSRPLILVAHSLGGVVCKEAILLSQNSAEPHLQGLFTSVRGVMFMGTPHRGSWMAEWAKIPASALSYLGPTNTSLLEVLETDSQYLESVQIRFWTMVRQLRESQRQFEVTCFFEELPLPIAGIVVPKESATLEGYNSITIHADHRDLVRFASSEENGFKRFLGELVRWQSQIGKTLVVGQAGGLSSSSSANHYGSSTQNINSITTGAAPVYFAQHQTIHQTIGEQHEHGIHGSTLELTLLQSPEPARNGARIAAPLPEIVGLSQDGGSLVRH